MLRDMDVFYVYVVNMANTGVFWVKGCQGCGIIGVLAIAAAAILEVLCTVVLSKTTHKFAFISARLAAFLGAASIIIVVIIWRAKLSDIRIEKPYELDLGWSFGLSIAGGVLAAIGGVLAANDLCKNSE